MIVGLRLLYAGLNKYQRKPWADNVKRVVGGYLITMGEIPDFFDEWFWSAFNIWQTTKHVKAPVFSGGWAEWPHHIVEIIKYFDIAHEGYLADKRG